MRFYVFVAIVCLCQGLLVGCGESDAQGSGVSSEAVPDIDAALSGLIADNALTGDPATPRNLSPVRPDENALVKLGQQLFFSQTLSGSFDVACATCHLPYLGGSDGLSLPVGVVPVDRRIVGPARRVNSLNDNDTKADGGPNMHRNSMTTFNAGLLDRVLMFDGRIRVSSTEEEVRPGGHGQLILTPESGVSGDVSGVNNLLDAVAKFPITNDNEMRGYLYSDISEPDAFRNHLVERFKGNADQMYMRDDAAANWLALFRNGFNQPTADADDIITLLNIQKALGEYVRSQTFVDTPWKKYIGGDQDAISLSAKQGAALFYTSIEEGGAGLLWLPCGRQLYQ